MLCFCSALSLCPPLSWNYITAPLLKLHSNVERSREEQFSADKSAAETCNLAWKRFWVGVWAHRLSQIEPMKWNWQRGASVCASERWNTGESISIRYLRDFRFITLFHFPHKPNSHTATIYNNVNLQSPGMSTSTCMCHIHIIYI